MSIIGLAEVFDLAKGGGRCRLQAGCPVKIGFDTQGKG